MRNLILTAVGLVSLSGLSYFMGTATGQGQNSPAQDVPHKVGLIDMGQVFNEYKKLTQLKQDYTVEQQEAEAKAKQFVEKLQSKQQEIKEFVEGSPEYTRIEKQLAALATEFETFKKITQRDLMRKEAKMFQTVYLEVQDVVERVAKKNGYTLVLRFSRDELNTGDPQKMIQGLNRQVVYSRSQDDMTQVVLKYLNSKYSDAAANGDAGAAPPRSAAAPKKASQVRRVGGGDE
ncbi:MAG: OmpH family outer membrane protein [Planctomycetaceae bacterium]